MAFHLGDGTDLLARRIPAQAGGIVHGDYRAGNVAFGPDGAIRAVFDWELATSGDPMADLGWLAATWQDPGEPLPPATPGPSAVPGFPARARYLAGHMGDDSFAARLATPAESGDPGAAGGRVVLAEAARDALREGSL